MENMEENREQILWKKDKSNSEKIWKIQKKLWTDMGNMDEMWNDMENMEEK